MVSDFVFFNVAELQIADWLFHYHVSLLDQPWQDLAPSYPP